MQKENSKEGGGLLAGLDEVGRGCLAGPLCIAVVAFPKEMDPLKGVTDSKKLSEKKRMELAPLIVEAASFVGIGWGAPSFIDEHGITTAWQSAALIALKGLAELEPETLIVDGIDYVGGYQGRQKTVVKGDLKHWQCGAASIVAKVTRDVHMRDMGYYRPEYKWGKNKGYGTKDHREAILEHGPCWYHRSSFLKKLLGRIS